VPISINWLTKVISIPQNYLTPVSAGLYELDVNQFRLDLKNIEDNGDGMAFEDTHRHETESVLSGVTYARKVTLINGYTVTFEDGQYSVRCSGANHNIADVKNVNQVSLIIGNSAGLIVAGGGAAPADIATAVWAHATATDLTLKMSLALKVLRNKMITNPSTGVCTIYDDDGTTVLLTGNIFEDVAGAQPYRGQGADRRDRLT
jgi:hypothetical protein